MRCPRTDSKQRVWARLMPMRRGPSSRVGLARRRRAASECVWRVPAAWRRRTPARAPAAQLQQPCCSRPASRRLGGVRARRDGRATQPRHELSARAIAFPVELASFSRRTRCACPEAPWRVCLQPDLSQHCRRLHACQARPPHANVLCRIPELVRR
eukprot:276078-Chlamydomonas_euryale.AAC.2